MLKWAVKNFFFLAIAIIVALPITALVVDDDTVSEMLQDIPGGTGQTGAIIMHKRLLASTIINYVDDALISLELIILETTDDALSSLKLTFFELFGTFLPDGSQKKVVVYLPTGSTTKPLNPKPKIVSRPPSKISTKSKSLGAKLPKLPATQKQSKLKFKKTVAAPKKKAAKKNIRIASAKEDHKRGLKFYNAKNFKKASKWFIQAAKKGYAGAQYNLGVMRYLGQGVPQDYAQAASWFEKAGNQDHASAQYNLGYIYYEGKGVEKDNLQAYMWIDRSANLGDKKAIRARDTMQIFLPEDIFN